jgi:hypothetical protein
MPEELIETNASKDEPQITNDDHAAFDSLADQIFTPETPAEPVQKPETTPETPAPEKPTTEPVKEPIAETTSEPAKPEVKAPVTPTPEAPTPDPELEKISPPRGLSPKSLEGWNALKAVAKQRGEKLSTVERELADLKPKIGQPDPEVSKKISTMEAELAQYRAMFTNERSPEFIEKYDKPLAAADTQGTELLVKHGLPQEHIDKIKALGGLKNVPPEAMSQWINAVSKTNLEDGEALKKAYLGSRELTKEREKALEEVKLKPQEFLAKQEQETTAKFQDYTQQMAAHVAERTKDIPWCKIQEIPANATPEQKAQIEEQNKFYQESEARFQAMLYPKTPQARVETALAACLSFKLAKDLQVTQNAVEYYKNQYEQAQASLDGIKKAGVTSRGGGSVSAQAAKKPAVNPNESDDDAIERGLLSVGA